MMYEKDKNSIEIAGLSPTFFPINLKSFLTFQFSYFWF